MGFVVRSTEVRELRCPLSEAERHQRAERVAELLEQIETIEAEQASARSRFKSRLEVAELEKRVVLDEFRTGAAMRAVQCELHVDLVSARAQWVRTDTGELLAERGLRDEERQGLLFDDAKANGDEEPDGDELEAEGQGNGPAGVPPAAGRRRGGRKAIETGGAAAR